MPLLVNEIFYSIQGESIHTGRGCVFIRLAGCNLRCSYCDTKYAYYEGTEKKINHIINLIEEYKCNLIEITGGEPLLQEKTSELTYRLLQKGYEVLMETNGSLDINRVDRRCVKIVDIKCPSSGESEKVDVENLKKIDSKDQVKFVIINRHDYDYAKKISSLIDKKFPRSSILFSPAAGEISPAILAGWILEDKLEVRLHLQIHKIIWPNVKRGV